MHKAVQHILLSSLDWDDIQLPIHHVARSLAAAGEDVLFVPADGSFLKALNPRHTRERERVKKWWHGERRGAHERAPHLVEWFPPPLWHMGSRFPWLLKAQCRVVAQLLRRQLRVLPDVSLVLWVDHPFYACFKRLFPDSIFVGYIVDDIRSFPHVHTSNLERAEQDLAQSADLVLLITSQLEERYRARGANTLLCHNGAPAWVETLSDHVVIEPHEMFAGEKKPVLGCLGSTGKWVDIDLLEAVADAYPEANLFLVGPVDSDIDQKAWRRLKERPNVRCHGRVPASEVPCVLAGFDVCLLPFALCDLMSGADPQKMYEYLAMGKPTVAMRINRDMDRYADLVYLARNRTEFVEKLGHALSEDSAEDDLSQARVRYAQEHSWPSIVSTLRKHLFESFGVYD